MSSQAVDRVLAQRSRRQSRRPEAASLAGAFLLHAGAVALVLLLPRLSPPPPPMTFVPVQIIPAAALGVRRPASRPRAERPAAPEPEPARPEPSPEPAPAQRDDVPVLPTEKPERKPDKPRPETSPSPATARKPSTEKPAERTLPAPAGGTGTNPAGTAPQGTPEGEAGRRGSPTGNPLGTTAFGSEIAGLDNPDFKFGYYIDQLLSAIDAKWVRPPLGNDVEATIAFRIGRDGTITDLTVARSSGYNSFDLAALRAVQHASPFPLLPRAYRHDSLGVNLIVR